MKLLGNLRQTLADRLAHYREARGWTQHDLAAAADMSVGGIRGYEQRKRWPDPEELDRIADALVIAPSQLLVGIDELKPSPKEALEIVKNALEQAEKRERELSASARSIVDLLPALDQAKLTDSLLIYVRSLSGTGPDPLDKGRALLGSDQPGKKRRDHRK